MANVVVGYGVAVATQMLVFPLFGLQTTLAQNLKLGAVFFDRVNHSQFCTAAGIRGGQGSYGQTRNRRPNGAAAAMNDVGQEAIL